MTSGNDMRKSTNMRAAEALEKMAEVLEFSIWLQYGMHVDRLDRSPSKFLEKGFTNFMSRGNIERIFQSGDKKN